VYRQLTEASDARSARWAWCGLLSIALVTLVARTGFAEGIADAVAQTASKAFDDSWIKFEARDWGFLVCICGLAIYFHISALISEKVSLVVPPAVALAYGIMSAIEAGYGIGTQLMVKGALFAFGSILARQAAQLMLDKFGASKEVAAAAAGISAAARTQTAIAGGAVPTVEIQTTDKPKGD
jgi:hypothetical protein